MVGEENIMNLSEKKLTELKNKLESIAFLVSKAGTAEVVHAKVVQGLVLVAELQHLQKPSSETIENIDEQEIGKVISRLKLWSKRPHQINSRILNAYLQIKRSGKKAITESDLMRELPDDIPFVSNFLQMKISAKKNHGKIFEQYGEYIEIWKPVLPYVCEYEEIVFGGK